MRMRNLSLRAFLSALLAVVFVIAAEPGVMAMPAPAKHMMTMTCADMPGCNHKLPKDKDAPCKNMALCAGMMSCFGMSAVASEMPLLRTASAGASVHVVPQTLLGLTLQPDNPPPIA
jgi:hypothetical protein